MQADSQRLIKCKHQFPLNKIQRSQAEGFQDMLTIDWGDYEKQGWSEISSNITQISAHTIQIFNNHYARILRQLSHISFPKLIKINVSNNSITSIQCLISYDWPVLSQLNLSNNLITSLRPLAKANLENLYQLNLNENPIVQCENLFKANFSRLKRLLLSTPQQLRQKNIQVYGDPITWQIKLQPILEDRQKRIQLRQYGTYRPVPLANRLTYIKYKEQIKEKGKILINQPAQTQNPPRNFLIR